MKTLDENSLFHFGFTASAMQLSLGLVSIQDIAKDSSCGHELTHILTVIHLLFPQK